MILCNGSHKPNAEKPNKLTFFIPIARRDEEGAVITAPKQITTNPIKKGPAIDSVLLSKTKSYNACGEPFKQVGAAIVGRKQDNDKIAAAGHEKVFSPSKIVKLTYKPPYEHAQERVHV